MAKSADYPNIYQDVTCIKEADRPSESYENYRLEELGRFRTDGTVPARSNSCCTSCCHGDGYVKTCLIGLLVVVVLGAVSGGIALFVNAATAKDCQCHFTMPDGYVAQSQTETKEKTGASGSTPDTRITTEGDSVPQTQETRTGSTTTIQNNNNNEVNLGTAVFTRWGRTRCPNTSTTLYSGYTAGSPYDDYGGTSSVLCLPANPRYGKFKSGYSQSFLHGAEYDSSNQALEAIFGKTIQNNDMPCAVCEVTGRSTSVMFPALQQCFDGWTLEYTGYLMSSHVGQKKSIETICVDNDPETLIGESQNSNGARFYFVEADGQLPEPPYFREAELTCAICSK
ncbi:short-chain collagen C4-like [Mercenaria mercenaria]|uniref:short-chain collagen C4-like n=1 Tax=Mercenaria mercenaria TaxID=6596 RepID=UPI00234E975F|nr:short-chain collagen C4-like [Mercenaria mercenaria]